MVSPIEVLHPTPLSLLYLLLLYLPIQMINIFFMMFLRAATENYSPFAVFGYADSDWAMDIHHHCSISGIVFKFAGAAIAWKCRVQPTVSLS